MDLNDDGHLDILSGSYSREGQDMAGTFQVLWGTDAGKFSAAETLNGSDDQPLLIPGNGDQVSTDRICTRPTAADINGDGTLDIVSGNFTGTFFIFLGQGKGVFAPESKMIMTGNEPLRVQSHSDPFLIDWDEDGDLDIVSGSAAGGVFLSINAGTKQEPAFTPATELVSPAGHNNDTTRFGDSHIAGPQSSTRVWVDDLNDDGKLDLLVGDSVRLMFAAEGLDEAEARTKMEAWDKKQQELMTWWMEASKDLDHEAANKLKLRKIEADRRTDSDDEDANDNSPALTEEELATLETYETVMKEYREKSNEVFRERREFVRDEMTGFVWVYFQQ